MWAMIEKFLMWSMDVLVRQVSLRPSRRRHPASQAAVRAAANKPSKRLPGGGRAIKKRHVQEETRLPTNVWQLLVGIPL
jgi:hypothetical protein